MALRRMLGWALATLLGLAPTAQAAEELRLGAFLSLTGTYTFMGDPEKKALELLVERTNSTGGVLGRPIRLIAYDDGSDPEKAMTAAKRLIENDRVDFIIGGSGTPTSMAVLPLMEKAGMPFVSMGGGIGIVEPVRNWTFKIPHSDRMGAEKVLTDLKRRGLTRLALLSENVGFGKSGRDQVLKLAPSMGIEVVADEIYGPKDADVTPQLTKIRGTNGVQALFVFGTGQGPAVVTRNIRQLGLDMPVYQSHGVVSKEFLRLVSGAADGMRLPAMALAVAEQLPANDPQKPVALAFKAAFEARWHQEATIFAGHAADAFAMVTEALRRAGSADKAQLRGQIERTKGLVGTGGIFTMTPTDHLGLDLGSFHMVEIRNGDWVLVD
ncbi:MAG: ABC transporter substrate-binding protein [Rhodospirillaceae bacterium]|nr:ABC transporter substrate-binding protein [Rhodospirillales bacterium]